MRADSAVDKASAAAKAWTAALFLLDGTAEAWWWLGLIRSADQAPRPWTDSEDGGVGAAPQTPNELQTAFGQDDMSQGDAFSGAGSEAGDPENDEQTFDKEVEETLDRQDEEPVRQISEG